VVYIRDNKEIGMAHKVKSPEKPISIFPDDDGAVLVKLSFQVDQKCFQKVVMEF